MVDNQPSQGLLCPTCRVDLVMSERQGIEIDYCPQCRGVWLDRGELDKIIERSAGDDSVRPLSGGRLGISDGRGHGDHGGKHGYERGHKGRRESFLSELFD
jgi:Zn-finger nucleic acid-binding protein